jgi:hypothetical protein
MARRAALTVFLVALLAGAAAGLYLGWVALPAPNPAADPSTLHPAYKDDYVLMIATAFAGDGDLASAQAQLAALGFANPADAVAESAARLNAAGLPPADQERLAALTAALAGPQSPALSP